MKESNHNYTFKVYKTLLKMDQLHLTELNQLYLHKLQWNKY